MQNLQRVRRYQRELEDAEGRADQAESSLHLIRARHTYINFRTLIEPKSLGQRLDG